MRAMIYTFYSYKGGVGRTMALANVADLLRQRGLKVIVVDWELESPDLEHYFPGAEGSNSHPGLVDLLLDFKESMRQPINEMEVAEGKDDLRLPDLEAYVIQLPTDDDPPLLLLPAGKRRSVDDFEQYARTVRFFDWKDFYHNWEGELFFKWLQQELCKLADVVLINSCPGISEIANICTQQMANVVMLFCGSNRQSLDDTLKVAAELTSAQRAAARRSQPVHVIIVPARIDERAEAHFVLNFKQNFVEGCRPYLPEDKVAQEEYFWDLRVPNVPRFTFKEELVVRTPGADEGAVVSAFTKITQAMARFAPPQSRLYQLCGDKRIPVALSPPLPPKVVEPYRGLSAFLEEHASLFFGRSAEIKKLLGYVERGGLVAVIGPSGSGKSSLVQAGLLPRVRKGDLPGSEHWEIVILTPSSEPFAALAAAFAPLLREAGEQVDGRLADTLAEEEGGLGRVVNRVLARRADESRVLLIVDQFEELFTLPVEALQQPFLIHLVNAVESSPLTIVLTLRSDFYEDCEQYGPFIDAVRRQTVTLDQMSREGLKEAVVKPAELMGVSFEAGLADRILEDVGAMSGNLPLLQFALTRLWEGRMVGGLLTHQVYADIGGVKEAIAQCADKVFQRLSEGKQKIARRIFTQLVQLNEGGRNTRRRATFAELGEPSKDVREIVKVLSDARLLVVRETAEARNAAEEEPIDIAHEALIHSWKRMQEWLDEDRKFLLWRQNLRTAVAVWKVRKRDRDALLRGRLLHSALDRLGQHSDALSQDEKEYIAESHRQETRHFWRQVAVKVFVTLLLVALGLLLWATRRAQRSKQDTMSASGYYVRGKSAEQKNIYEAALENYNKAIQLSPEFPDAYLGRAHLYNQQDEQANYPKAIADYTKFIELTVDNIGMQDVLATAYDGRGQVYFKLDNLDSALSDFVKATEIDRRLARAWYDYGRVLANRNQPGLAIDKYTQAITNDPNFYWAYLDRGHAFYQRAKLESRRDDLQHAVDDFKRATELNSDKAEPYFDLGLIYANEGDYQQAIERFTEAINRHYPAPNVYNERGQALASLGQTDKALTDYKVSAERGYLPAYYNLGLAYQDKERYDDAIKALEVAISSERYNTDAEAFWRLGEVYAKKGDNEAAIRNYNKSIELKPDQVEVYFSRGVSYAVTQKNDDAINDFLKFTKSPSASMQKLLEARQYLEKLDFHPPHNYVQIHLHYNEAMDMGLLEQIKSALNNYKAKVFNSAPSAIDMASVRYFQKPFKYNAEALRDIIKKVYESNNTPQAFRVGMFPGPRMRDTYGWIEVWLPAGRPAPASAEPTPTAP